MTPLQSKLRGALEYDDKRYPWLGWIGVVNKLRVASKAFRMGAAAAHAEMDPIHEQLLNCVRALENIQAYPGDDPRLAKLLADEALDRLRKLVGEK